MLNELFSKFSLADNLIMVITTTYTIYSFMIKAINLIKKLNRQKYLKELLGNTKITIHIPERNLSDRLKAVIAKEDYNTYEHLKTVLEDHHFKTTLKYIPDMGEVEFSQDSANIVICGPKNSLTTRRVMSDLKELNFKKDEETNEWYIQFKDKKLYSPLEDNINQYAFLGKVTDSSNTFLLICGIHAIGSDGVSFFLNDNKKIDHLLKQVQNNNFYCIIKSSFSKTDKQVYSADVTEHIEII